MTNSNVFYALALTLLTGFALTQSQRAVYINANLISNEDVAALELFYQVYIPDGAYWYDPVSGLVGPVGGPSVGQIMPGLALGSLQADASGGGSGTLTGTFVNGRELHPQEVADLTALLGVVYTGYFWLDAAGNLGYEGGGYLLNLVDAMRASSDGLRGDGRSIFGHSLTGSVIGDGDTVGFIDGDLGITCGPDGGCTGW